MAPKVEAVMVEARTEGRRAAGMVEAARAGAAEEAQVAARAWV